MNKRLQQFLQAENISQSQFADTVGITRAGVSHTSRDMISSTEYAVTTPASISSG